MIGWERMYKHTCDSNRGYLYINIKMLGLIGRLLFVSYFLFSAYEKITQPQKHSARLTEKYTKYISFHQKVLTHI